MSNENHLATDRSIQTPSYSHSLSPSLSYHSVVVSHTWIPLMMEVTSEADSSVHVTIDHRSACFDIVVVWTAVWVAGHWCKRERENEEHQTPFYTIVAQVQEDGSTTVCVIVVSISWIEITSTETSVDDGDREVEPSVERSTDEGERCVEIGSS